MSFLAKSDFDHHIIDSPLINLDVWFNFSDSPRLHAFSMPWIMKKLLNLWIYDGPLICRFNSRKLSEIMQI